MEFTKPDEPTSKFPKVFPVCTCGEVNTITKDIIISLGMTPDQGTGTFVTQTPIINKTVPPIIGIEVPILLTVYDVCSDCGTIRAVVIKEIKGKLGIIPGQPLLKRL